MPNVSLVGGAENRGSVTPPMFAEGGALPGGAPGMPTTGQNPMSQIALLMRLLSAAQGAQGQQGSGGLAQLLAAKQAAGQQGGMPAARPGLPPQGP
jgi:hypothetical protein